MVIRKHPIRTWVYIALDALQNQSKILQLMPADVTCLLYGKLYSLAQMEPIKALQIVCSFRIDFDLYSHYN